MEERGGPYKRESAPPVEQPERVSDTVENERTDAVAMDAPQEDGTDAQAARVLAPVAPAPATQNTKDPILKQVEEILAEDLTETYNSLPPALQQRFKKEGEETATAIQRMMQGAKVHAKKVLQLLVRWLRIIPHVNRFFLEQEAKIKTDRILALAERQKNTSV